MYWSLVSVRCSVQDIQQWDGSAGSLKGEASGQVSRRSNRALEGEAWDVQVSLERMSVEVLALFCLEIRD